MEIKRKINIIKEISETAVMGGARENQSFQQNNNAGKYRANTYQIQGFFKKLGCHYRAQIKA